MYEGRNHWMSEKTKAMKEKYDMSGHFQWFKHKDETSLPFFNILNLYE
jgi:hypothetical protein